MSKARKRYTTKRTPKYYLSVMDAGMILVQVECDKGSRSEATWLEFVRLANTGTEAE
jgi:hypothetical protein